VIAYDGVSGSFGEGVFVISDTGSANDMRNAGARSIRSGLQEGYHYATVLGSTSVSTTATWVANIVNETMFTLTGRLNA
jgi:hypothetical protein